MTVLRRRVKWGSIAALIGCAIMTAFAAYQGAVVIHDLSNPALLSPSWATYAVIAVVIVFGGYGGDPYLPIN